MKRKFILLPITLTALTPAIGLVGCGNPDSPTSPETKYDYEVNLDTFLTGSIVSNVMTFQANKRYKFNFDLSKSRALVVPDATKTFTFMKHDPFDWFFPKVKDINVFWSGEELLPILDEEELNNSNYFIEQELGEDSWFLLVKAPNDSKKVFNIYLTFKETLENVEAAFLAG